MAESSENNMIYCVVLGMVIGMVIGGGATFLFLDSEPILNIDDDPRACVIRWEDGEIWTKSREISLGTIEPGEEKHFVY